MPDVEGFILVGGASSRMGADKAALRLGGLSFVERIRRALGAISDCTRLVGAQESSGIEGRVESFPDVYAKWGALGGLHAALAGCRAKWAAVAACDLPFVTGELFAHLISLRENFDAIVPVQRDGRAQPLCAIYRKQPCLLRAEELIAEGERRPRALLESVRTRWVSPVELEALEDAPLLFMNVNTPADFERARVEEELRRKSRIRTAKT